MSRLTDFRTAFAGHCAKADRKQAEQARAARRVSASTGHDTRPLKLSPAKSANTNTHENH